MRKLTVSLEHRFYKYDNKIYTKLSFPYLYWSDYLSYFDEVEIVARVNNVEGIDSSYRRVDGDRVNFISMPYYIGIKQFIFQFPKLLFESIRVAQNSEYFLLRSGNISNLIWPMIMLNRKPYLREYPGNVKEGIIGFGGNSYINIFLANILDYYAKVQARYSKANSYVSEYCKKIYPSNKPSYVFSSFNADEITVKAHKNKNKTIRLISVGRLEGEKGHRDLIKAISVIDFDVETIIIGDGSQKENLEAYANSLGVKVNFMGAITDREKLFCLLASSDVFVIPSHTEGMPRSLLEAMTIGLPCLGTSVGGIPEVLDSNMLFSPNDSASCAKKISELISNKELAEVQAKRNVDFIKNNYSKKSLDEKKIQFWSELYR
ncbi:glycosyltransferase family 4 protein [Vibrio alginolyticus]|uniref:glycosyltransferase family 4 protein n=1 Tax=Vibrio alginolyticus TaxID=663 RepID=UPI001BD1FD38|nr:glycosyltransferase family 4 protein [Vibrio alginolyticus]MBS9933700.1 glycosyltransferase family 4 protein [Vibrio alginolyticus]